MVKRSSKRSKVSRKSKRLKKTKMNKRNYKKRTIKRTRGSQRGGLRWRRSRVVPYTPVLNDDDELTDDRGGWWRRMRRNRVVPEYFPSLNWAKMRYGLKKGWRMLDEASIDRLKHCLNNSHERIKIFTKSVSKRGYLYTTRNSLLPHQEYFEKTEEYRGLIDNLPVEEVDGTLNEFINKKYTEVMTEINLDISPLEERRLNYSPSAQSTFTIFRNSEHIILVKREAGGVAADREILGSIVGSFNVFNINNE